MIYSNSKNTTILIWLFMYAIIVYSFRHLYQPGDTLFKVAYGAVLWLGVFLFPYKYIRVNDFGRFGNFLLKAVIVLTIVAFLRSAFAPQDVNIGNKWVTLLGNPECMFTLITPCFMYLCIENDSVIQLKRATQVFLVLCLLVILSGNLFRITSVLWFSAALYPFMKRKYKVFVLLSMVIILYIAFYAENTSRSSLVLLGIAMISYLCVYIFNKKWLLWSVCLFFIIAPLIYAITMLVDPNYSIFSMILDVIFNETGDEILAADTRTFLFWEMAEDMNNNNTWILGKGALSHYYSNYFANSRSEEADHWMRLGVEVTFLQMLLRSGIVYVATYYSLITYAVISALKNSKNKFLLSVAVMGSGWSLYSCMSYLNGCTFVHVGMFLLLGCCISKKWLNYSDFDIRQIFSKH